MRSRYLLILMHFQIFQKKRKSVYTSVMERIHWKLHPGDPSMHRFLMPSMQSMLQIWNWEDGSRVQISAEQLLAWDPDVIVVNGEPKADKSGSSAAEDILSNPDYASLKAVQDQKVYGTPNAPFSWVDRPAGPNRLIGMRWFSALIYPEYIKCDINEEIHKFFDLFYHVDLSDEQLENVLKGTL